MWRLRLRPSDGPVPYWAATAVIVAIAATIAVVVVGTHEQHSRRISSELAFATVTKMVGRYHRVPIGPVRIGRAQAIGLADLLNNLPQTPSGDRHCPASYNDYRVHFTTRNGAGINVELGFCLGVEATSAGQPWGWQKWDRDGAASAAIERDLRRR